MKIMPIEPVYKPANRLRQQRAFVGVGKDRQTVHDIKTGESFDLPPIEAWILNNRLNREV